MVKTNDTVSNKQTSLELDQKLSVLLQNHHVRHVPFHNKRVHRRWIADSIGCHPSTLSTNPRLRKKLLLWEKDNCPAQTEPLTSIVSDDNEFDHGVDSANVVPFLSRTRNGLILPIDLALKNKIIRVPTLYWHDHIDEWVSDYLRHLRVHKKQRYSSVEEAAKKLRIFRRFMREHFAGYRDVTDDFLIAWQHRMEKDGISVNRRNDCVTTVHTFFRWAEETGRVENHVQLAGKSSYGGRLGDDYVFPISSREIAVKRKGVTYNTWVSTITETGSVGEFRHTPTSREIERLRLEVSGHGRNSLRNNLLLSWALETGGRVSEILQIVVSHFPTMETVGEFMDRGDEFLSVSVERKNIGKSTLKVPVDLIVATLDYLWNCPERQAIVARYGDCGSVFLSEKGGVLSADSVTRLCGRFFALAKIENANIHRLRAKFITEIIETVLDELQSSGVSFDVTSDWGETVLIMARNRMGHTHIMSLRPYLNEIRVRRVQMDGKIVTRDELDKRGVRKELDAALVQRVRHNATLAKADRLLGSGQAHQAGLMLRALGETLIASAA